MCANLPKHTMQICLNHDEEEKQNFTLASPGESQTTGDAVSLAQLCPEVWLLGNLSTARLVVCVLIDRMSCVSSIPCLPGLDASMAFDLLKTLHTVAKGGRLIVLSIHQPRPEIYYLFNSILFLCKGKVRRFLLLLNIVFCMPIRFQFSYGQLVHHEWMSICFSDGMVDKHSYLIVHPYAHPYARLLRTPRCGHMHHSFIPINIQPVDRTRICFPAGIYPGRPAYCFARSEVPRIPILSIYSILDHSNKESPSFNLSLDHPHVGKVCVCVCVCVCVSEKDER